VTRREVRDAARAALARWLAERLDAPPPPPPRRIDSDDGCEAELFEDVPL
jgi:hypothetical protein